MKASRLQRIRGVYAEPKPPKGCEDTGKRTPAGDTIWRRKVTPRTKKPKLGPDGEQVVRGGNPMLGVPGTPVYEYVPGEPYWQYLTISSGKHGNNRINVIDVEAMEAAKAAKKVRAVKDKFLEGLAERVAEVGMDLGEAVDRVLGLSQPEAQAGPEPATMTADADDD